MAKNFVITIARGFGSGGKEIALKVAEKLRGGLIAKALEKFSFPKELVPQNKRFEGDVQLFEVQRIIIRELAKKNSCVIVGKCADFILRDFDNVGSFYIEAPRKQCLESIRNMRLNYHLLCAELKTRLKKFTPISQTHILSA